MRTARRTGVVAAAAVVVALALGGCQTGRAPVEDDGDGVVSPGGVASPDDPVSSDDGDDLGDLIGSPSVDGEVPTGPVTADLTVVVDATGEGATTTWTLTCEPTGGDHPEAEEACAALTAGRAALAPTPPGQMCTEQWGGPQTATVTGTIDGETVRATFSRVNGCEISRWDALEPLLGGTGGGL